MCVFSASCDDDDFYLDTDNTDDDDDDCYHDNDNTDDDDVDDAFYQDTYDTDIDVDDGEKRAVFINCRSSWSARRLYNHFALYQPLCWTFSIKHTAQCALSFKMQCTMQCNTCTALETIIELQQI